MGGAYSLYARYINLNESWYTMFIKKKENVTWNMKVLFSINVIYSGVLAYFFFKLFKLNEILLSNNDNRQMKYFLFAVGLFIFAIGFLFYYFRHDRVLFNDNPILYILSMMLYSVSIFLILHYTKIPSFQVFSGPAIGGTIILFLIGNKE